MFETTADNLGTFFSAAALVVSLAVWLIDRYVRQRRIVSYRVHLNTKIDVSPRSAADVADLELRRRTDGEPVPGASLTLVRVKNAGRLDVDAVDIVRPLTFTFPRRSAMGVEVVEPSPVELRDVIMNARWPDHPGRVPGPFMEGDRVELPPMDLNEGVRFKLLVLLSGDGNEVHARGYIRGGKFERDTNRRRNRGLVLGGLSLLLAGLLIGLVIVNSRSDPSESTVRCLRGQLQIEGSTAFAPVVKLIADEYHKTCGDADIAVVANGSISGLRAVANTGANDPKTAAARLAMSDGPASGDFGSLVARPVSVVVFSLLVNDSAGIHGLTVDQVQSVYDGRVTNWKDVGGNDAPIRLISRGSESGTRGAFERRVLGTQEPPVSSNDCFTKDRDPNAATTRCEFSSEASLLDQISRTPGALGYAERGAAATYPKINEIALNGWTPDISTVERGDYPFWEVEYLYTYGTPPGDSLLSAFLEYVSTDTAKNLLRGEGFTPCVDRDKNLMATLCATRR
ncbi:substrate-binding domain-containing protein [Pseudofrankia saprophytica]|uniref:substrate-binding domain-containing protein n=1 Tax=Pseudofrankia saprophytica TaxID=298655 RepID=UPI000234C450|nr:substrate-binding domain-containing protein [Pseudofrankia saprophytica]